jgi:hypothetical protein
MMGANMRRRPEFEIKKFDMNSAMIWQKRVPLPLPAPSISEGAGAALESVEESSAQMVPARRNASRAGCPRSVVGSGSMDTRVANRNRSQTWVVIFLLRGGFLTTDESAGSMAQRDNRHLGFKVGLHAVTRLPALRAVVR